MTNDFVWTLGFIVRQVREWRRLLTGRRTIRRAVSAIRARRLLDAK